MTAFLKAFAVTATLGAALFGLAGTASAQTAADNIRPARSVCLAGSSLCRQQGGYGRACVSSCSCLHNGPCNNRRSSARSSSAGRRCTDGCRSARVRRGSRVHG
jgi:hypothetical protein